MKLVQWTPANIARRNAWEDLDREFESLMNWAFGPTITESGSAPRRLSPAMDLVEEKDHYLLHFDLPGMKKEDIEITFQDGVLTVRGERKTERDEKEGSRVVRKERYVGTFERSLPLPEKVDGARMKARFENGVLEIHIPFLPEARPVRLEIQ